MKNKKASCKSTGEPLFVYGIVKQILERENVEYQRGDGDCLSHCRRFRPSLVCLTTSGNGICDSFKFNGAFRAVARRDLRAEKEADEKKYE